MAHFVGDFNEEQLNTGADKAAFKKASEEYGETYSKTKIIKKKGVPYLRVWTLSLEEYINEPNDLDALVRLTVKSIKNGGKI